MKRRSKYYKVSNEEFIEAVKNSFSINETLRKLGMNPFGAAYKVFKTRVLELGVSTEHFTGQGHLKGKNHNWGLKIPLEEILVENSTYACSSGLKKRLLKENLLTYNCYVCGINDWNNCKLSLQLDHINGINNDHRLENLRLLCPNCHSQTDTFTGFNKGRYLNSSTIINNEPKIQRLNKQLIIKNRTPRIRKTNYCIDCNKSICLKAKRCQSCDHKLRKTRCAANPQPTKIKWIPAEQLIDMLQTMSYLELGRCLGVSDNAVRKHIRASGLIPPKKHLKSK